MNCPNCQKEMVLSPNVLLSEPPKYQYECPDCCQPPIVVSVKNTNMEEEIKNKTIYDLKLNETLRAEMKWGVRIDIMRVAGGWIYQPINREAHGKDQWLSPCFVPFSNEFQFVDYDDERWKL